MTAWVQGLRAVTVTAAHHRFVDGILKEETSKPSRLRRLKDEIGLPVYETYACELPTQMDAFKRICGEITTGGGWDLALRIVDSGSGKVLVRHLGLKCAEAIEVATRLPANQRYAATILPYREPTRSGTLLASRGSILLEFVFGPHYAITQCVSGGPELFFCRFGFPQVAVEYSTPNPETRRVLFQCLREVSDLVFGCRVKDVVNMQLSAYAEFHWHLGLGYRFVECSFNEAWTGNALTRPESRAFITANKLFASRLG